MADAAPANGQQPAQPDGEVVANDDGTITDRMGHVWRSVGSVWRYLGNAQFPSQMGRAENENAHIVRALQKAYDDVNEEHLTVTDVWKMAETYLDEEEKEMREPYKTEAPFEDMQDSNETIYFDRTNPLAGSLMMSEYVIIKSLIRYNLLTSSIARARYSKMYHALKDHFRVFFRDAYNIFQKLHWSVANGALSWMMTNDYVQRVGELRDLVVSNVTLGPAVLGQRMIDTFKARVLKTAPEELGGKGFLIASLGVVSGLALVGELLISRRTGSYTNLVAYLVEELNKMVIKSSYRYRNVLRLFIRMMSGMGAERASYIVQALGYLQTPSESFAAFAKIPTFANVDDILQRGAGSGGRRKGLRKYVYGLMDELDKGRDLHRASTGWSKLHFNVTGG